MKKWDAIVVGAGNGGLTAAAYLAKAGKKVLVLEQHNLPGGFATSFVRGRFEFEASLHELCGVGKKPGVGGVRQILEDLDMLDEIEWFRVPTAYHLISRDKSEGIDAVMPFGVPEFIDALEKYVPGCRESVEKLFGLGVQVSGAPNKLGELQESFSSDTLKALLGDLMNFVRTSGCSTDAVLNAVGIPEKAKKILTGYWCYLGEDLKNLSFMHFMSMLLSYIECGAVFPKGKSHALSCTFVNKIESLGGEIWLGTRVTKILVEAGRAMGVEIEGGEKLYAGQVICDCSPHTVFGSMMDSKDVPPAEIKKANARKFNARGFALYLGLDKSPEELGIKDHGYFIYDSADSVRQLPLMERIETNNVQATVCLNMVDPGCSPEGTTILYFTTLYSGDDWGGVRVEDYYKTKREVADRMISVFEETTGIAIRDSIEEIEIASPVTYAHYTGTPEGTIYGYRTQGWDGVVQRNVMAPGEESIIGLRFCGGFGMYGLGYSSSYLSGRNAAQYAMKGMEGTK